MGGSSNEGGGDGVLRHTAGPELPEVEDQTSRSSTGKKKTELATLAIVFLSQSVLF